MIIGFLLKKNFITLVPVRECYFQSLIFKSDKKLSQKSILFNYQKRSPFSQSSLSYIQTKQHILLWFYDKKYRSFIILPEGYLHYRYFAKIHPNVIAIIENKSMSVIKDGILHYQTAVTKPTEADISILRKQYSIDKVLYKTEVWYRKHLSAIQNQSLFPVLKHFTNREQLTTILKEKISALLFPLMVLVILMSALQYGVQTYLQEQYDKISTQKERSKKKTKKLFDAIAKHNKTRQEIQRYRQKYEQSNIFVLQDLAKIVEEEKLKLYYTDYSKRMLLIRGRSKEIENFLGKLSKIKLIDSYKLTRQIKNREGKLEVAIEIYLKQKGAKNGR